MHDDFIEQPLFVRRRGVQCFRSAIGNSKMDFILVEFECDKSLAVVERETIQDVVKNSRKEGDVCWINWTHPGSKKKPQRFSVKILECGGM